MKMKTIKEIKTIEIELLDDSRFKVIFNGIDDAAKLNVLSESYRQAARALTRLAMEMWAKRDAILDEKKNEK
jgi:hypothetical protein